MSSPFYPPGGNATSRDGKYRVASRDGELQIEIEYYEDQEVFYRPSTRSHPDLVAMVGRAKGYEGGTFVINEWGQVIVGRVGLPPAFGGDYFELLEFNVKGVTVSAEPPSNLERGEPWPGPGVGRIYTLAAGGEDIYYEQSFDDGAFRKAYLSKVVGVEAARDLAQFLAEFKSTKGGPIYINERRQFFSPGTGKKDRKYLGPLGDHAWFGKVEPE